jgi:hypothetical protein
MSNRNKSIAVVLRVFCIVINYSLCKVPEIQLFIYYIRVSVKCKSQACWVDIKNETLWWLLILLSDSSFTHHCWLLSKQITIGHPKYLIVVSVLELKVLKKFLYLVYTFISVYSTLIVENKTISAAQYHSLFSVIC